MPGFDMKQVARNDKGLLGAGAVAFIASFLPYWGFSYHVAGRHESASVTAWHSYAILGLLLLFIGAGTVAARVFANATMPKLPVGINLAVLSVSGLGTLLVLLRGFTWPHASGFGGSYGVQWGGYLLIIAGIVQTVFAVLNFLSSGEKVAWDSSAIPRGAAPASGPATPPASYAPYPPPAQPTPSTPSGESAGSPVGGSESAAPGA